MAIIGVPVPAPAPAEQALPVYCASAQPDTAEQIGRRQLRIEEEDLEPEEVTVYIVVFFFILVFALLIWKVSPWDEEEKNSTTYYAKIDTVAGLDPEKDLLRPGPVDPEFNLTLGVASRSARFGACFLAGTAVAVSYRTVPLAAGVVPKLCVDPKGSAKEGSVVAWGSRVPVPRMVRDVLVADLQRGAAEFDVALTVHKSSDSDPSSGWWDVVSCKAKVGDAAAFATPCSLYRSNVPEPVDQPGYAGFVQRPEAPPESGDHDE
ncbi:hypothetical protein GUJ93_ZPchr0002g24305 [Zizania palustris]|uniref:Uncharacterized protein n=1 Tax=Zizania palustris TaxID=103762 RepID=A0A8J5SS98_ZIZPA|nr:hypothetical protein GUJ93_ZPchr0002g24305 [Zizania palustris]